MGSEHRQRGRLDQAVEPGAAEEADMVSAADVVKAFDGDPAQEAERDPRILLKQIERRENTDPG